MFRHLVSRGSLQPVIACSWRPLPLIQGRVRRRFRRSDLLALLGSEPGPIGGDPAGVREPRRPRPAAPASAVRLPVPGTPTR